MKILNRIKNILFQDEYSKLIKQALDYPRYKPITFSFEDYKLSVTDFLSVAWQIKEIFGEEEMKIISNSASPVIYDCGANVGISAIYFRRLFPSARIHSFEPDPEIFKCLEENLKQNNISGVELFQKAVWTSDGVIQFGSEGADGGSVFQETNKKNVEAVRLKNLLAKENKIDLLKIDIEGAEVDVLIDCKEELQKVDNLFVEYHSWKNQPQKLDELLVVLKDSGYRYFIHSVGEKITNPFITENSGNPMDVQLNIHAKRR